MWKQGSEVIGHDAIMWWVPTTAKGLWPDMISVQILAWRGKSGVTTVTKADYGAHATKSPSCRIILTYLGPISC